jgi:hypothetical protein
LPPVGVAIISAVDAPIRRPVQAALGTTIAAAHLGSVVAALSSTSGPTVGQTLTGTQCPADRASQPVSYMAAVVKSILATQPPALESSIVSTL